MPGSQEPLEVVALGGLGEFGMNMMAVSLGRHDDRHRRRRHVSRTPICSGVDLIIPDLTYLQQRRVGRRSC